MRINIAAPMCLFSVVLAFSCLARASYENSPAAGGDIVKMDNGQYHLLDFIEGGLDIEGAAAHVDLNIPDELNVKTTLKFLPAVDDKTAAIVAAKIQAIYQMTPNFAKELVSILERYQWRFVTPKIEETDDLGPSLIRRIKDMTIYQAAVRDDVNEIVVLRLKLWKFLTRPIDRAGLILHELIYALLRIKDGDGSSSNARNLNNEIFLAKFAMETHDIFSKRLILSGVKDGTLIQSGEEILQETLRKEEEKRRKAEEQRLAAEVAAEKEAQQKALEARNQAWVSSPRFKVECDKFYADSLAVVKDLSGVEEEFFQGRFPGDSNVDHPLRDVIRTDLDSDNIRYRYLCSFSGGYQYFSDHYYRFFDISKEFSKRISESDLIKFRFVRMDLKALKEKETSYFINRCLSKTPLILNVLSPIADFPANPKNQGTSQDDVYLGKRKYWIYKTLREDLSNMSNEGVR